MQDALKNYNIFDKIKFNSTSFYSDLNRIH